jgi:hypothetical protein
VNSTPEDYAAASGVIGPRAVQDFRDDLVLGVGVLLDVRPFPGSEPPLGVLIQATVVVAAPEAVAEPQVPFYLRAAGLVDVQVDVGVRAFQAAVLVPVRLPDD